MLEPLNIDIIVLCEAPCYICKIFAFTL